MLDFMSDQSAGLPSTTLHQSVNVLFKLVLLPEAKDVDAVHFLEVEKEHA